MNSTALPKDLAGWLARPKKSPSPKGRIKHASSKRAKQLGEYRKIRKNFLEKNPRCQVVWSPECLGRASEIHHSHGKVGELLNDERWFLPTCRPCHDNIHRHPSLARKWHFLK